MRRISPSPGPPYYLASAYAGGVFRIQRHITQVVSENAARYKRILKRPHPSRDTSPTLDMPRTYRGFDNGVVGVFAEIFRLSSNIAQFPNWGRPGGSISIRAPSVLRKCGHCDSPPIRNFVSNLAYSSLAQLYISDSAAQPPPLSPI